MTSKDPVDNKAADSPPFEGPNPGYKKNAAKRNADRTWSAGTEYVRRHPHQQDLPTLERDEDAGQRMGRDTNIRLERAEQREREKAE